MASPYRHSRSSLPPELSPVSCRWNDDTRSCFRVSKTGTSINTTSCTACRLGWTNCGEISPKPHYFFLQLSPLLLCGLSFSECLTRNPVLALYLYRNDPPFHEPSVNWSRLSSCPATWLRVRRCTPIWVSTMSSSSSSQQRVSSEHPRV